MEVNSASHPEPDRPDAADRAAARRDGRDLQEGDLRAKVQQIAIRQQRFERFVAKELGVDMGGLEAMDHLISTGSATPTELAHKLGISTAATTLVLNRLEAGGHIRRERHPSDGRKLVVTASEQSADEAQAYVTPLIRGVEALIESLTDVERRSVESFLEQLLDIYDSASAPTRNPPAGF